MSSPSAVEERPDESPQPETGRAVELAPSSTAADDPSVARIVGMIGAAVTFVGAAAILADHLNGPKLIGKGLANVLLVVGLVAMLYHAARDAEQEIRRTYGWLGFGLVSLSIILWIVNKSIFPYSALGFIGALFFLNFFARHESEKSWRTPTLFILGGLGFGLVGLIVGAVLFNPKLIPGSGAMLGLLALLYITSLISHFGSDTESGRKLTFGLGGAGLALIVVSVVRSLAFQNETPFFIPSGLILCVLGALYLLIALGIYSELPLIVMTRREIGSYFVSPIAYLVLLGMAIDGGINHYFYLNLLKQGLLEPIVQAFLGNWVTEISAICIVPVITMRLISEEKRSGTYEVLMSLPVSETSVVLSKFFAALVFFVICWVPWGLYLIALQSEMEQPFDYRPLLSFYFALIFVGSGFIGMGLFFSSVTKNQIVAAVLTFGAMLALTAISQLNNMEMAKPEGQVSQIAPLWRMVIAKLDYFRVWTESLGGRLPLNDLFLHASFGVFWVFLTIKSLEARKWN